MSSLTCSHQKKPPSFWGSVKPWKLPKTETLHNPFHEAWMSSWWKSISLYPTRTFLYPPTLSSDHALLHRTWLQCLDSQCFISAAKLHLGFSKASFSLIQFPQSLLFFINKSNNIGLMVKNKKNLKKFSSALSPISLAVASLSLR